MNNIKEKVILITGASKGIGKVTVKKLAEYNPKFVLVSRNHSELESVQAELKIKSENILLVQGDVSKEKDCKGIVESAIEKFGTIDILINNAAQFGSAKVLDIKIKDFDRVWETNVRGVLILTQLVLPFMIKQNCGTILNISSTSGKRGYVGGASYAASKFALNGMMECLLREVREYNIRVLTISPSMVDTREIPENKQKKIGKGVYMRAEDVADSIYLTLNLPQRALIKDIEIWGTNP